MLCMRMNLCLDRIAFVVLQHLQSFCGSRSSLNLLSRSCFTQPEQIISFSFDQAL